MSEILRILRLQKKASMPMNYHVNQARTEMTGVPAPAPRTPNMSYRPGRVKPPPTLTSKVPRTQIANEFLHKQAGLREILRKVPASAAWTLASVSLNTLIDYVQKRGTPEQKTMWQTFKKEGGEAPRTFILNMVLPEGNLKERLAVLLAFIAAERVTRAALKGVGESMNNKKKASER